MSTLFNLIVVVQVISALAIIGLVLLQHGKGADMGAAFGSGASGSLFGASGSSNFLSKSTAVAAFIFFSCTLGLSYIQTQGRIAAPAAGGIMERTAPAPAQKAPATAPAPASQIPLGAAPAAPAAPAQAAPAAPASAAPASSAPASQIPK
ncbi:MAG: preprotein translocase subunit SecG [Telluria sp.]